MTISTFARGILTASFLAVLTAASTCFAQFSSKGPGMDPRLTRYFGDHKSFSTKVEMEAQEASKGSASMVMNLLMLEGKMRMEMDMAQVKSAQMPANAAAQMKQMGMDKVTIISRPDKKLNWMIYPGLKAYTETPMTSDQLAGAASTNKIEIISLGKETIDGHPCEKRKLITTDETGKKHEALVWNATDLKDFPIQMQMNDSDATVVMKYKETKFEKPDSKLFEAPDGLTKYDSLQGMMQAEMMKRMGAPN